MGYCQFGKAIPVDAPTGRWRVEFSTDPASKEAVEGMTLRIEEFLPERMKLDLASADAVLEPGQPFRLEATGAYLYGRSEERRVGQDWVSTCRSRGAPYH